ncbi:putative Mannosyltransferase [Nakaseomyces glabratus]|nr:putative Mannosyltransferase [Nakaseomyces glabratus]KAH7604533.1 putative Mannosyltransferase [Nakaseomyces glabratus]
MFNRRFAKLVKLVLITVSIVGGLYYLSGFIDGDTSTALGNRLSQEYMDSFWKTYDSSKSSYGSSLLGGSGEKGETDFRSPEAKLKIKDFYKTVFEHILDYSPAGKTAREFDDSCFDSGDISTRPDSYKNWKKLSYHQLSHCMKISPSEINHLRGNHKSYVDKINELVLPKGSYKGEGIVTVGGGKFTLMALTMIKALRTLGTTLPVEVFIPPDEGESTFCESVLPQYNAKCIYISDILPDDMIQKFTFKGYQFKSLAMITSSFENLLLLDADNIPVKKIDHIFESQIFRSAGLILWPDFWRRTTMPAYYEIANLPYNQNKRVRNAFDDITPPEVYTKPDGDLSEVPFHDMEGTLPDPSTESGQLLISKAKHLPTLLLSLYYNVNGPNWYYPIFSQRTAGEGDKETFISAASFYSLSYYQVKTSVGVDGYFRHDGSGYRGVGMLQHDFIQDSKQYMEAFEYSNTKYNNLRSEKGSISYDPSYDPDEFFDKFFSRKKPDGGDESKADVMFVHCNLPKFDPYVSWDTNDLVYQTKHFRSFNNKKVIAQFDIELENFKFFNETLCPYENGKGKFKYLDNKLSEERWPQMCDYISKRLQYLKESHNEALGLEKATEA